MVTYVNPQASLGTSLRSLVKGFILTKQTEDKSPGTVEYYQENLNRFLWYAEKENCLSSLVILMVKEPTLLELAETEKNSEKLKEEIQILLQPTKCMKETQQAVKRAMVFFHIGRKNYFDAPNFLLRDLNPFNRFWDNLISLKRTIDENYDLAQQATYRASPNEIFATDSSMRDYLERVRSFTTQTTELANKIVNLVRKNITGF